MALYESSFVGSCSLTFSHLRDVCVCEREREIERERQLGVHGMDVCNG